MVASVGSPASGSRSGSRAPVLAKYDVLEELGHGGMATVYRAHDKRLSRDVAIKVLHPHLRESQEIAHRFSVEAKAVAKLRHANIVEVFDVSSEDENEQYLVVELVRGPTLRKLLQKHGSLPPEIGAAITLELLSGIGHAHESGVVHRDVKPENVLIEHRIKAGTAAAGGPSSGKATPIPSAPTSQPTPTPISNPSPLGSSGSSISLSPSSGDRKTPHPNAGERAVVKLTDFGIAKLLDAQGVTSTGQVLGSPAHMAPEQIEGGDVDGRADVFGLGVLLYECMVGHLPFLGNNPAQVLRRVLDGVYASAEREKPTIGKVWSQIIDKALARKAENRYADAGAMRDAISAELSRLGMASPRIEIEAWLDDPEGWSAEHERRLIERLCQTGAAARKRGDSIAAAADYNRALAYAPNDPTLLRVVVSMQRSEARMRLVRRVAPLVLGAIVLGTGAFFIARAFKSETDKPRVPSSANPSDTALASSSAPQTIASAIRSSTVNTSQTANVPTRVTATPVVASNPSAKPGSQRIVSLVSVRPAFGVRMAVDGTAMGEADPSKTLTLDDKPHTIQFTCTDDLCVPKTITLPAGDKTEALTVDLAIVPAKLFIEGDSSHSYGIEEMPNLVLAANVDTDVSLQALGSKDIHVFDRTDPTVKQQPTTLKAGKKASVSFKSR